MKFLKKFEKSKGFWFVVIICSLFFFLRLPSLYEPLWYGDEGIYQAVGSSISSGKILYQEAFDNKPPLLYWTYSLLGSDQFSVKFASLLFGLLAVSTFYLLSRKLFQGNKNNIRYLTTTIFAVLFGLPILEGNIANAENFMLLPIVLSAILIISQKRFFIAGLLLGIAFLFKIVAVFDFCAFFVFIAFINYDLLKRNLNKLISLTIGFLLPILLTAFYFIIKGAFLVFLNASFFTNVSYVSWGNRIGGLPILLLLKLILLGIFVFYLFTKRKEFSKTSLFIFIWTAFSLFNSFFSQRPYNHYLLVLLPSFSLLVGLIFFDKKFQRAIVLCALAVLVIVVVDFKITNIKKNFLYYGNFISYVTNNKTTKEYQEFFDRNTPADYEVANYIKPKLGRNDTIVVWGNNAQLYKLTNVVPPAKYVVAYHVTNYKDGVSSIKNSIEKTKPKYIVEMQNVSAFPFPLLNYSKKINIDNAVIYERIF